MIRTIAAACLIVGFGAAFTAWYGDEHGWPQPIVITLAALSLVALPAIGYAGLYLVAGSIGGN
jgi:hypothetical protein